MDVRQLKYFIAIVDRGSFTKASELLGIAQPSLGFQIRKLEDELNVQILVRNARGVQLTEAGQQLYERGKKILEQITDLTKDVSERSQEPHGSVALGLTPSLADRFLLPIIERTRSEFPKINLSITEEMSLTLIEMLEIGRIRLALAYNVLMTSPKGIKIEHLADEDIVLLMHPDQAPKHNSAINFCDIEKYSLILPRKPHRLRNLAEKAAQQCDIELNITYEMQSLPTILRLVAHGLGATLIAGGYTNRMVREGQLVFFDLINPSLRHDVSLIHLESRPLSRAEDCVAKIVRNLVSAGYSASAS
jgi:LysR family nitrogen assimilation transcriptional regulator